MSDGECEEQNISIADPLHASTSTASGGSVLDQQRMPTILNGKYFSVVPEKSDDTCITGQCQICLPKTTTIKGRITSTSNFLSHLKRKHSTAFDAYSLESGRSKQRASSSSATNDETKIITQNRFEMNVAKFAVRTMIPLKALDDESFREIFEDLKLGAKINVVSRRTLGRNIDKMYLDNICDIKNELKTVAFVCTTADIWSGRRRSFFGVTAHWIATNYERRSVALACRRFAGEHTFSTITELLHSIHAEFGLTVRGKIVATITDNASNFAKAFRTFGVQAALINVEDEGDCSSSNDSSGDEESTPPNAVNTLHLLPLHVRCSAHTLNLCITTDMIRAIDDDAILSIIHKDIMENCNSLWKAAIRPKSAEIIRLTIGHALRRPGETRWNSLYDSLRQIVKIEDKMTELTSLLGIRNVLGESDFLYLKEHLECTKPIAEAIDILQGDNIFYGVLLPCLLSLRLKLTRLAEKELEYCKPISKCLSASLQSRFEVYLNFTTPQSHNAALAALTHPEFKNSWFPCISDDEQDKVEKLLKSAIIEEMKASNEIGIAHNQPCTSSNRNSFFEFGNARAVGSAEYASKAALQVLHYFGEENAKFNILEKYTIIKKVFVKYNTPLPSSAPVERLFSYATMTNAPKSNRLSDSMFEKRVVLKANLKNRKGK